MKNANPAPMLRNGTKDLLYAALFWLLVIGCSILVASGFLWLRTFCR